MILDILMNSALSSFSVYHGPPVSSTEDLRWDK